MSYILKPAISENNSKHYWKMFLDFDSFFAHVEKQADPALWGKPVAVTPLTSHASGVIACCYQAKALGVKRGMRRAEAEALAPEIVFRHARHDEYIYRHWDIIKLIEKHVPVEKAWSVDEMSIDLKKMDLPRAIDIVHAIKAELHHTLGPLVTASFGIAQTGLLAKIASEMNKPDGLVVLHPDEMPEKLYDLPLGDIPGVARGMLVRLRRAGVTTTKDLLDLQPKHVRHIWGSVEGERLWRSLHGQHTERPETKRGMFGHSRVLARSWRTPDKANECIRILGSHAARRLRAENYFCTRMMVGVRTLQGERLGLRRDFPAVRDDFTLHRMANETFADLIRQTRARRFSQVSIVLMGIVRADEIIGDLFAGPRDDKRYDRAVRVMDALNNKYAKTVLKIGAPEALPGGYDGVKIAFGRIPAYADIMSAAKTEKRPIRFKE